MALSFLMLRSLRRRRIFLGVTALAILVAAALDNCDRFAAAATGPPRPSVTPGSSHEGISFRDRLIAGLQARRGTEVEFIDRVVLEVRLGRLPERLVNQTFFWARDRAARPDRTTSQAGTRRPIIYFQPVMTRQARLLRVDL